MAGESEQNCSLRSAGRTTPIRDPTGWVSLRNAFWKTISVEIAVVSDATVQRGWSHGLAFNIALQDRRRWVEVEQLRLGVCPLIAVNGCFRPAAPLIAQRLAVAAVAVAALGHDAMDPSAPGRHFAVAV
jgi:hypothetical protein